MSRSYYYFVASLPMLSFDIKPPIALEEFLEDCRRLLSSDDYARIETVLFEDPHKLQLTHDVFGRWIAFNRKFRNELALARAVRLKKDPQKHVRGERAVESFVQETIAQAMKVGNPFEAERILDSARWRYLDELEQGRFFHFDNVLIFALKLQILERYQTFKSPKGQEIFEEYKKFEITSEKFV